MNFKDHDKAIKEKAEIDREIRVAEKEWAEWKDREFGEHGINKKLTQSIQDNRKYQKCNSKFNVIILCVAIATLLVSLGSCIVSVAPDQPREQNNNQQGGDGHTQTGDSP